MPIRYTANIQSEKGQLVTVVLELRKSTVVYKQKARQETLFSCFLREEKSTMNVALPHILLKLAILLSSRDGIRRGQIAEVRQPLQPTTKRWALSKCHGRVCCKGGGAHNNPIGQPNCPEYFTPTNKTYEDRHSTSYRSIRAGGDSTPIPGEQLLLQQQCHQLDGTLSHAAPVHETVLDALASD